MCPLPLRDASVAELSGLFEHFDDDDPERRSGVEPRSAPGQVHVASQEKASEAVSLIDAAEPAAPPEPLLTDDPIEGRLDAQARIAAKVEATYEIPNFEADERDLSAYDDAKKRFERQQIASAESAIRSSFTQKRDQLRKEIDNARSFEDERRASALHTTRQYANSYPQHVNKTGVAAPSFWENLFSLGRAHRLYRAAFVAGEALDALRTAIRKREESLAALEGQMSRAIYLKEEQIKKSVLTDAGIAEFHERPEVAPLIDRVERIKRERKEYHARLERGEVRDEEQRDRAMAEHHLEYAKLPIMGGIIARVARYGKLTYFQLRDLEKHETLLSYDARLDPLRNAVFDVYTVAEVVAAKLKRNDNGTAFRVADHFKHCWRNQDEAEDLYSQHRAALRENRGLPKMEPRDAAEAEIIDKLAALAGIVEGSQSRNTGASLTA